MMTSDDIPADAEYDPGAVNRARYRLDVAGHYGRPDVFELQVHRNTGRPIAFRGQPELVGVDGTHGDESAMWSPPDAT